MSLFKTLQHSPSTITLFHNSKIPLSSKLYQALDKFKFQHSDKNEFQVDLMNNTMPTYDQYRLIVDQALSDQSSKEAFKRCFPFLEDRQKQAHTATVTVKGVVPSGGLKIFSEGEYNMIYEAFNALKGSSSEEGEAEEIFHAPLIIDWDLNKIANDEEGLENILKRFAN